VGTPLELYERPANLFVAGFLGSPRMNAFPVTLAGHTGGLATVRVPGGGMAQVASDASQGQAGAAFTLGVRPEHLRLATDGETGIPGRLALVEYLGDVTLAYVQVDGVEGMVSAKCPPDVPLPAPGTAVRLRFDPARAWLFDEQGVALPALGERVAAS
jgi:multiple sugar transport system ATP-binding protein